MTIRSDLDIYGSGDGFLCLILFNTYKTLLVHSSAGNTNCTLTVARAIIRLQRGVVRRSVRFGAFGSPHGCWGWSGARHGAGYSGIGWPGAPVRKRGGHCAGIEHCDASFRPGLLHMCAWFVSLDQMETCGLMFSRLPAIPVMPDAVMASGAKRGSSRVPWAGRIAGWALPVRPKTGGQA